MAMKQDIKTRILTENTAQSVLKHLRELESNRARVQGRWIWELLQNARDAAAEEVTSLEARVELHDGELVFQHNGHGFTEEEVAHLIFHGSTKVEDDTTIGQYGSGFLTTHLLSADIDVSGELHDGRPFNFRLRREVTSASALSESMNDAWDHFFDVAGTSLPEPFTTRFSYPISNTSSETVREGIDTLRRCGPLVVAFNSEFRRVDIITTSGNTSFEVSDRVKLDEHGLERVTVQVHSTEGQEAKEFILAHGGRTSIAVPVSEGDQGCECLPIGDVPRLFLGFPLIGTENFSFPSVINSFDFVPTENRDGVFLGQSTDDANTGNQTVLEEAGELHIRLMRYAAQLSYRHTHALAAIPPVREQPWLNPDWIRESLSRLVGRLRRTPAIHCGSAIAAPANALLPIGTNERDVVALWTLCSSLIQFREKLPQQSEATGWNSALATWSAATRQEVEEFDESISGRRLAQYIESETNSSFEPGTLESVQRLLVEGADSVDWLDGLYELLLRTDLDSELRNRIIVPNQAGELARLSGLFVDAEIDHVLKDTGDALLGLEIRRSLRDNRFSSLHAETGNGSRNNDDVLGQIIEELKARDAGGSISDNHVRASAEALAWMVANDASNRLIGFPAFSVDANGDPAMLLLSQGHEADAELPLAPVEAWPEDLQEFADLFPSRHIFAGAFAVVLPAADDWALLKQLGYVRTEVVVKAKGQLNDFLPDRSRLEGPHATADAVEISDIAFLSKDRIGVMARVRDSQERARLFWRFLTEWMVRHDSDGLELNVAACTCGEEHRYFGAAWLAPLVKNIWVPQGNDVRDTVSAQSLAKLLRESGWVPSLLSETGATDNLLLALGVTRFELTREFLVHDEEAGRALESAMTNVLAATGGNLADVSQFVEDMRTDKELPAHLAERRARRRIVHENQRMGAEVERLVKEGLEGEGFTVTRTGIGSDFEIAYDVVADDEEIGLELSRDGKSWLVEVKATRESCVRMTAKQAETAVVEGQRFLLCVVPIEMEDGTVFDGDDGIEIWFVQNIGPRVKELCDELDALNGLRDDATAASDDDVQLEIHAGSARIRVEETVWREGIGLEHLPAHLR